ncbi:MAG: STAS domain-containing protein [Phycisphaerae bacterium]
MIETEKKDKTTVVRPKGVITAANASEFKESLHDLVESGACDLIIDLANVEMIDSQGLAVFVVCHQTVSAKGGSLTVMTDNEDLRGLFRVMRLDQHFTVKGSQ